MPSQLGEFEAVQRQKVKSNGEYVAINNVISDLNPSPLGNLSSLKLTFEDEEYSRDSKHAMTTDSKLTITHFTMTCIHVIEMSIFHTLFKSYHSGKKII